MRRIGSPLLLALIMTVSFATVSKAQNTTSTASPPATSTQAQNPTPATTPATDPSTPANPPATAPTNPSATTPAPSGSAAPPQVTNTPIAQPTSPLTLHVGDADLTIGGFLDAMVVSRSTNPGTGLGTTFGTLPFSNTPAGSLSETRLSAQNSRVSLGASSKVGDDSVKGYLEADFLGAGPTNQFVTSNSATLRMRLYWVDFTSGKFEFLGGQSWSLLTPNRNGLSPNPGDIFYSQDIDTNYQAGLTWGRTEQFRFIFHPSDMVAAGVSLENPEQYVGSAVSLPAAFTASEVDNGSNTATPNRFPDVIGKLALDPKTGSTHQHFEVAGLVRGFKTVDTAGNSFSATGKGASVAANIEPVKNFHLIGTGFFSTGGGRYIANDNIPDFIVLSNSSMSLVKANSFIGGIEEQALPKTQFFFYYSQAKATADTTTDTNGKTIGFGVAGQSAANQKVMEASVGITQIFYRDPKIGGMQLMIQYSYVKRTPFSVAANAPTFAKANMVYVDIRYILP